MKLRCIPFTLAALAALTACVNSSIATETADTDTPLTAAPPADTARLFFAGDAMQHSPQITAAARAAGGRGHDYSECFTLIAPAVKAADYAVVNFEVTLGGEPYTGYPCFSAPVEYAAALRNAGFDLFLTANNHTMDRGARGVRRTIEQLDTLGVDHTGTWADPSLRRPFVKEIGGIRIGFLNYTYGTNGIPVKGGVEVAHIDSEDIAREIAEARRDGAEAVVVTIHWGNEYEMTEHRSQRSVARRAIDAGADLIIGSHPHVVQPVRRERGDSTDREVPVVYSLGNFISNQTRPDTRGGALVTARFVRDSIGAVHLDTLVPALHFTAKPSGGRNYRVVPSWLPDSVPAAQRHERDRFERAARAVLGL